MIESVLPMQLQMSQRRDKQLQLRTKEEDNSFSKKMNENPVEQTDSKLLLQTKEEDNSFSKKMNENPMEQKDLQKTEKVEAPKEIIQGAFEGNMLFKKELLVPKEHMEEKKSIDELLVAVSGQMLAIGQLHVQPELLYQYIQKIQELYKTYGNIKLNELPASELQQLVTSLKELDVKNLICLEDTMQVTLEKLGAPDKMVEFAKLVQSETCNLVPKEEHKEPIATIKKEQQDGSIELGDKEVQSTTTVEQSVKPIFSGNDQIIKENIQTQKVSLPDLGKKMEAQVAELQKFVVKQERVLFQLNPENLGTLTVYMKKQGEQIQVHVEMDKHDVKTRVEFIFDELKTKLKDKEIHIELSYTDKEQKHEQREREQPHKRKQIIVKEEKKAGQEFAGLLGE